MSRCTAFPIRLHVCSAKTQLSLHIRTVWSGSSLSAGRCFDFLGTQGFDLIKLQLTLVISKSKGLSEILRDVRSSMYQICRIEEKNRTTTFHKGIGNLTPYVRRYIKIGGKEEKLLLLFSTIFCYLLLNYHVQTGTRFSLRDKRLFEIIEFEITSRQ